MTPRFPQVAPRGLPDVSQMVWADPPLRSTLFNRPPTENPMNLLSGDQNGNVRRRCQARLRRKRVQRLQPQLRLSSRSVAGKPIESRQAKRATRSGDCRPQRERRTNTVFGGGSTWKRVSLGAGAVLRPARARMPASVDTMSSHRRVRASRASIAPPAAQMHRASHAPRDRAARRQCRDIAACDPFRDTAAGRGGFAAGCPPAARPSQGRSSKCSARESDTSSPSNVRFPVSIS